MQYQMCVVLLVLSNEISEVVPVRLCWLIGLGLFTHFLAV
jgi:hypothetical protein